MKYRSHPWPTNGATMKYVDRKYDRLLIKLERLADQVRELRADNARIRAMWYAEIEPNK